VGIELPVNYGPQYRDGLRAVYADLAHTRRTALVPFLLDGIALDPAKMQDDGLHPLASAEPQVLDLVWKQLQPLLHGCANPICSEPPPAISRGPHPNDG
ncbi:MAG TPA: hypothetical protein VGV14_17180, partial [Rhodanobacter sp.]|nr:hypothetical protein [Rhodanobacter sp.]